MLLTEDHDRAINALNAVDWTEYGFEDDYEVEYIESSKRKTPFRFMNLSNYMPKSPHLQNPAAWKSLCSDLNIVDDRDTGR